MGVSGLLPLLKSIQRSTELKKCSGETLGVDAYGWLHRAAYSCASQLGQDKPTQKYVSAAMYRVSMLRHFGVMPYMVFDGDFLPSKAATEESRAKKRDEKKKLAHEFLKAGKVAQATQEFQKCIDVTPEMACNLIHELKEMGIPYVVAPYEADAQLVFLERHGLIHGILSDDSDLLVFGAKRLLTKLDQWGNCIEINRRDFGACREISLAGWTDADLRRMAIMSGCDYIRGLPNVGLKTAYRMLRRCKSPERAVRMLRFQGHRISENYLTQFYQAELTFLHQWVFCPAKMELVHLTELDGSKTAEEMPYIGARVEPELARAIARGDVNPITKEPIVIPMTPSKRRHSQVLASLTSNLPAKPISSFFEARRRVPMGEMDPNCFSVDPQRIAQITDGGSVPRVFPLPRPYVDETSPGRGTVDPLRSSSAPSRMLGPRQRRPEPTSTMLSRVASSPTATGSTPGAVDLPAATPRTEPPNRPKKKARLCGEVDDGGSPENSKFFHAPKTRSPGRAKSDAYLLSDDSIQEALCSLPDIDGWKPAGKRNGSIAIFNDTRPEAGQKTQRTGTSDGSSDGLRTQPKNATPRSLVKSSAPPTKPDKSLSQSSETRARPDLGRLAFFGRSFETPASSVSRRSSAFSVASSPSTAPSTANSRLSPLQRLGVRATNLPMSAGLPMPRHGVYGGFGKGLPVNPSFVPLPKADLEEAESLNRTCGSEDHIVPGSDGEEEDEVKSPPKKLNLSRFRLF